MEKQVLSLRKHSKITIVLENDCIIELQKYPKEVALKILGDISSAHFHFGPNPGNSLDDVKPEKDYSYMTM